MDLWSVLGRCHEIPAGLPELVQGQRDRTEVLQ